MTKYPQDLFSRNALLDRLPKPELNYLAPQLEPVSLTVKQVLHEAHVPIEHVYFPTNGVISLVLQMGDGSESETTTVGNDGVLGTPVILEADASPTKAFCQIPGDALRIGTLTLKKALEPCPALRRLLLRHTQIMLNQISQSSACNSRHRVEQRMCRWLLMSHDRVDGDEFVMTQEFLAGMLGVRRPSVSSVASVLQEAGLIAYSRGMMTIQSREGLEAASCECYESVKQEANRLLGMKLK